MKNIWYIINKDGDIYTLKHCEYRSIIVTINKDELARSSNN